jgi:mannitol/fructose-specific phosphotransferase system IIA component (Ntr-type)
MELRDFFSEDAIKLELEGNTKDEILKELIDLLGLDDKSEGMLFKMLKRRENLGSTGIGRGIAIPHCRSLVVSKLRVAFGRKSQGVDFKAIDEKPVYFFFLIVAPPLEVSNQYLPVLGKIAQFSKGGCAGEVVEAETAEGVHAVAGRALPGNRLSGLND